MTAPAGVRARSRVGTMITRSFRVGQQLRADDVEGGSGLHFTGYATVWDEPYELRDWWGDTYSEVMRRGCFAKSLAENADVRFLLNHSGIPLARTKSGTLSVLEDDTGLASDADLDGASPLVQEIRSAMQRGDLDEMSLAFRVIREVWSPDFMQVDVTEAELLDVSVVTYPANPATSAGLRSLLVPDGMNRRQAARAVAALRRSAGDDSDAAALAQHVGDALGVDSADAADDEPAVTEDAVTEDAVATEDVPGTETVEGETPDESTTSTGEQPEEQRGMSLRYAQAIVACSR